MNESNQQEKNEGPDWMPSRTRPWFAHSPGEGFVFVKTQDAAQAKAQEMIESWLDEADGWHEEVESVFVGQIVAMSTAVNVEKRPEQLDEDGCDEDGVCWGDFDQRCQYELQPIECPTRHELQATGAHPAPCAKFCESFAYKTEIAQLKRELAEVRIGLNDARNGWEQAVDTVNDLFGHQQSIEASQAELIAWIKDAESVLRCVDADIEERIALADQAEVFLRERLA